MDVIEVGARPGLTDEVNLWQDVKEEHVEVDLDNDVENRRG